MVVLGRLRQQRRGVSDHDRGFFRRDSSHDGPPPQILGDAVVDALAVVVELDRVLFSHFESFKGELLNFLSEVVSSCLIAVELLVELR